MAYEEFGWQDSPSTETDLDAATLEEFGEHIHTQAEGIEIAYAEITSPVTLTAPGSTPTDITGLTITVPAGPRPFVIEVFAPYYSVNTVVRFGNIWLWNGSQNHLLVQRYCDVANENFPLNATRRLPAPVASTTYQVRGSLNSTGNLTVTAGTAGADLAAVPAFIRATQV